MGHPPQLASLQTRRARPTAEDGRGIAQAKSVMTDDGRTSQISCSFRDFTLSVATEPLVSQLSLLKLTSALLPLAQKY
jgi:hypothetical protein